MQITKELLDQEIAGMQAQQKQAEALVAQTTGALTILTGLKDYLARQSEGSDVISSENKAVQDELENQNAIRVEDLATLIGGPGAEFEIIPEKPRKKRAAKVRDLPKRRRSKNG